MGLCSQPRNADPPEQQGETPPYGFPNNEVFPYGYAKSTLLSHPYLSITLLLYCTMRDYSQCRVFKDNQVPLERHCRHFVRLPSSQFLCQPQKNSDMQVTRPCCARDITIPSLETTFLRWLIFLRVDEIRTAGSRQAENAETLRWIHRALEKFWCQELNSVSTG